MTLRWGLQNSWSSELLSCAYLAIFFPQLQVFWHAGDPNWKPGQILGQNKKQYPATRTAGEYTILPKMKKKLNLELKK